MTGIFFCLAMAKICSRYIRLLSTVTNIHGNYHIIIDNIKKIQLQNIYFLKQKNSMKIRETKNRIKDVVVQC